MYGRHLAGNAGSNPGGIVVCFQVEISATILSLAQRSPTECVYHWLDQVQQYPSAPPVSKKKVNQSRYRPGVAQRVPGS